MSSKKGKNQHVVPRADGWAIRGEGNSRDTVRTSSKQEAIERAREIAIKQQSEVVIHRPDGKIQERQSYGNDPHPPRDWVPSQPKPTDKPIRHSPSSITPKRVKETESRYLSYRIITSKDVLHGKPHIAGTRIMVSQILDLISAGKTVDEIISEDYFPDITAEDVYASIEYANHSARNNNTPS